MYWIVNKTTKVYYLKDYMTYLNITSAIRTSHLSNLQITNFITIWYVTKVMEREEIRKLLKAIPGLINICGLNIILMWYRTIWTFQIHWFLAMCLKSANARRIGYRIWSKSNNKSFEMIGFIEMTTSSTFGFCTSP